MSLSLLTAEFLDRRNNVPQFRQGSQSNVRIAGLSPLVGARAGTVNDAGGLVTNIDCRNYKSATLQVETGVVGTTADCKIQDSPTSGGVYADTPNAAITQ